jgi:hypothetical protein
MNHSDSQPTAPAHGANPDPQEIEHRLLRAERMECLAALTSGLTHALSNLLASTLMSVDLVLRTTPEGTAKQLLLSLQTMTRDGLEMVRQVLGIARGTAGEPAVFQPQYLLVELQKLLTAYLPALPVVTSYPHDLWPLRGDPQTFVQLLLALCLENGRGLPAGASLHLRAANVEPGAAADADPASPAPPAALAAQGPMAAQEPVAAMPAMRPTERRIVLEIEVQPGEPPAHGKAADSGGRAPWRPPAAAAQPAALWIVERPPHPIAALAAAAGGTYEAPEPAGDKVARLYLPAVAVAENAGEAAEEPPPGAGDRVLIFEEELLLAHALREVLGARGYRAAVAQRSAPPPAGTPATAQARPASAADFILAAASLDARGRWRLPRGAARTAVPVVLMIDAATADALENQPPGHHRGFAPRAVLCKPFTTTELLLALATGRKLDTGLQPSPARSRALPKR